jgi:hypothetical protein
VSSSRSRSLPSVVGVRDHTPAGNQSATRLVKLHTARICLLFTSDMRSRVVFPAIVPPGLTARRLRVNEMELRMVSVVFFVILLTVSICHHF